MFVHYFNLFIPTGHLLLLKHKNLSLSLSFIFVMSKLFQVWSNLTFHCNNTATALLITWTQSAGSCYKPALSQAIFTVNVSCRLLANSWSHSRLCSDLWWPFARVTAGCVLSQMWKELRISVSAKPPAQDSENKMSKRVLSAVTLHFCVFMLCSASGIDSLQLM